MAIRHIARYLNRYNELAGKYRIPAIRKPSELLDASAKWPASSKEQWVDELWAACGMDHEADFLGWLPFTYPFGNALDEHAARELWSNNVVSCLLGIRGFVPRGTPYHRLERAYAQGCFKYEVLHNLFMPRRS
jgi:hypothetical protein